MEIDDICICWVCDSKDFYKDKKRQQFEKREHGLTNEELKGWIEDCIPYLERECLLKSKDEENER